MTGLTEVVETIKTVEIMTGNTIEEIGTAAEKIGVGIETEIEVEIGAGIDITAGNRFTV